MLKNIDRLHTQKHVLTESLVYQTVFPHEHERMGSGEDHVTS